MKDSGIEWIGQIPQNWEVVRLKYVAFIKKNKICLDNPTILSLARDGIKIRDISTGEGQIAASYDNYNKVEIGDFLLNPMDLYSGANCNISYLSGVISPAYINLNFTKNTDTKFIDYVFKVMYWRMYLFSLGKGVSADNRWTLSNETLLKISIPFPPLDEQRKISEFLDIKCGEIDDLRKGIKEKIANLKAYKSSLITKCVTGKLALSNEKSAMKNSGISWIGEIPQNWEVSKIKYCFSFSSGLNITKENLVENGVPVISYGQIHSKLNNVTSIKDELLRFVSEEYLKNKKSLVKIGDFIIADTSEDLDGVGNFVFIDRDCLLFAGYHTIILQNNKNFIFGKFLSYLFQTDIYRSQLRLLVSGIKVFSITKKILADCKILVPPLEEQKRISEFLDKKCKIIDDFIANLNRQDEILSEYKKSLIYECVTGKLAMSNEQ